ncbi:MAG: hypothetical protein RMK97_00355 [Sutterellaceae bacterium]|nr:hypothetical protein [Burkholderiaceae bacterium]MCX7901155.1 hypothetical protein [Burkholderiaceae bacterium]MDW8428953.1 hypothetical protein [Sutterellaceae bacterium]
MKARSRCVPALLFAAAAAAEDRAVIDDTKIIGNRELPKVIYIVPWKKPQPDEVRVRPPALALEETLSAVDRDVFRRQVRYEAQLAARERAAEMK